MEMDQDREYVRLLSIFHFVVAAFAALVACIPLIHLLVGVMLATGGVDEAPTEARAVGALVMVVAAVMIMLGWAFAVCLAVAGYFLGKHRHYTFCLVMAGIACMFVPFGTVLGVLTIIVLVREPVKELFGAVLATGAGTAGEEG